MNEQNFGIVPYDGPLDISTAKGFTELKLSGSQQMQVQTLLHQLPSVANASTLSNVYTVRFPEGVTGTLMQYKDGALGTPIIGENGKIVGHASLESLGPQALAMGCFTAISVASSQYFLAQINNELKMIRSSLDKILEFLYGEKKAELIAEVSFVRYAHQNYASIMAHEEQRAGVIASLLDSKKIAMKDIEFYLRDLESGIRTKDSKDIKAVAENAFQMKESLEYAMQLYGMSSLLEVYYAQNFDLDYLKYVENDISIYINKCEKQMLGCFSGLRVMVEGAKRSFLKKADYTDIIDRIDNFVDALHRGEESEMRKSLKSALYAATKNAEYYMTKEGAVYLKTA